MEAVALAVLLVADHGLNATTVSEPPGPRATPDSGEGDFPVYRTELEKRRRGAGRHVETRDITDFGADSPGHLITLALEATAHDRALVAEQAPELDRLLLRRTNRPCQGKRDDEARLGVIGVGPHHTAPRLWEQQVGRSGSPMRRLRKTVNVLHRLEPRQNTHVDCPAGRAAALPEDRLERAVTNLIHSAQQHGHGPIAVAGLHDNGQIRIEVRDHGPGFPAGFLPTAFDRFIRADAARATTGTGPGPGHHRRRAHRATSLLPGSHQLPCRTGGLVSDRNRTV
ncbi:sensor histidine kinase [Streptomyces sp. NPDC001750]|uniref:sensor histidine kinase n=1 Tax=Streptomyces sp. NPDC001750 TaxID=3364607 RepID=UPI00368676E0